MNNLARRAVALPALVGATLMAGPAFAQTSTAPDLSPLTDAITDGLTAGTGLLMTFAPTVVLFSVVWMLLRKSSAIGKAG